MFTTVNILKPRTAGKAEGTSPTGRSTKADRRSPDGANTRGPNDGTAGSVGNRVKAPEGKETGRAGTAGRAKGVRASGLQWVPGIARNQNRETT